MANLYSQFTYDAALLLKAPAAVSSTAAGSLILDVGLGLLEAHLVIDVTALDVGNNDESNTIILQGSNDATFGTAADVWPLAMIMIGDHASTAQALLVQGADDAIGRYVVPCRNERNGSLYRYVRVYTVLAGTNAGITYSAFLAKD